MHILKGLPAPNYHDDPLISSILKGAIRLAQAAPAKTGTRRVVTFPLLLLIGQRIGKSNWSALSKQVIWAAATTAFFASARLGELLAPEETRHDPSTTLTWHDVRITSSSSLLIRLKFPKSGEQCEFLDIFQFPGYQCCPVQALHHLKVLQKQAGVLQAAAPVFRFGSGANLTQAKLNSALMSLLPDLCAPGTDAISCHSFRAGIPSLLSTHPDIVSNDMIKGWGRWQSDCYTRYTRLRLTQKQEIFGTIADVLRGAQPPPPKA
jgi:hypothetical protein